MSIAQPGTLWKASGKKDLFSCTFFWINSTLIKLSSKSHLNLYHLGRNLRWQIRTQQESECEQGKRSSWRALGITKVSGRDTGHIPDTLQPPQHHGQHSLKPLSLLAVSEVLLPAISNTCVPWRGFRQSNRSVGERKSGQHMSLTSPQRTSWNWECSQCVTNKSLGFSLQTAHVQSPKGGRLEPHRKNPDFSLCRGSSGSTSFSHLEGLCCPAANKCAPGTPWQRPRTLRKPLPEHLQLPGAATQVRVGPSRAHTLEEKCVELTRLNASFRCWDDLLAPGSL